MYVDAEDLQFENRAIVAVEALRGDGKTTFGLWAKGPVLYQRFDFASEGALKKVRAKRPGDIKVATYEYSRPETKKKGGRVEAFDAEALDTAKATYEDFLKDYYDWLTDVGTGSIVIDLAGTIWELTRIVRFGKVEQVPQNQYTIVNRDMKRIYNDAKAAGVNLVLLHHLKDEWIDRQGSNGQRESFRTGEFDMVGWSKTEDVADLTVRLYRKGGPSDPEKSKVKLGEPGYGNFCAQFRKCNEAGALVGETVDFTEQGEDNTFGLLMSMVYDNNVKDWE